MQVIQHIQNERILASFLNWGKGHLSRSIGIYRQLLKQNNEITVACSEEDFAIITSYLPTIQHIAFEDYPFHFSGEGDFAKDLWKSRKVLSDFIEIEQKLVDDFVQKHHFTLVLSDHRYGFRSTNIPSIFVTHQLNLALKWWQKPAQWIHNRWMSHFSSLWILDDEKNSLAGKLSKHGNRKNTQYIGHFSRFEPILNQDTKTLHLGVTNGPYPYNLQLLHRLESIPEIAIILTNLKSEDARCVKANNWKQNDSYFYQAKIIYAYCGYSTLMDLKILQCKGELIPTKGQSEQEYLSHLHPSIDFSIND